MQVKTLKQMSGASLIEVLVTMLILSTTFITLAALQGRSLQYNRAAYLGSQANILAYDILDRMRSNKANFAAYTVAAAVFAGGAAPTSSLAALDIHNWRQNINDYMPGAKGSVACNAARICTVIIEWEEVNSLLANRENILKFQYMSML